MHAATSRSDIDRVLDLIESTHRALRASHAASGWMDLDLTLGQIRFLHVLQREGSMSIGHVAELLAVTLTTASQFVDRLERPGYVERVHRDDDRRVVECRLTARGLAIPAAMRGMQREGFATLLGALGPRELRAFERLYRRMHDRALAAAKPERPDSARSGKSPARHASAALPAHQGA